MPVLFTHFPRLAVPALILMAFIMSVFFRGLDQFLFSPAVLCLIVAAFILSMSGSKFRAWAMPAAVPAGLLALFAFWMVLAMSWSSVPNVSTTFTFLIGAMPLLFFFMVQNVDAARITRNTAFLIACFISVLALWVVIQFVFLSEYVETRIRHPMLNPNNLAVILALGVFLWAGFLHSSRLAARIALIMLMILGAAAVLLTQSRGGMLGLIVGLSVLGAFCIPGIRHGLRIPHWKIYAAVGSVLFLALAFLTVTLIMRGNSFHVLTGGMGSVTERFLIWGAAFKMIAANPFPGIGLGVFYLIYPQYRSLDDTSDGFFVHWDPLQFGVEMSLIASVLFYAFTIAVLIWTIKVVKATQPGDPKRMAVLIPFCGLVSLMINTHVNFDLYMPTANIVAAVLLAGWYLAVEKTLGENRYTLTFDNKAHRVFILPVAFLLFVLSPVWLVRAGISVYDVEKASRAIFAGDMEGGRTLINHALKYGSPSSYRTHYVDAQWYGKTLQSNFMSLNANEREWIYKAALDATEESLKLNPYYSHAMNYQALMNYIAYPRIDTQGLYKAQGTMEQALKIDPLNFDLRMGLARLYDTSGQSARAVDVLMGAFEWKVARKYAPASVRDYVLILMEKTGDPRRAEFQKDALERRESLKVWNSQRVEIEHWVDLKLGILKNRLGH